MPIQAQERLNRILKNFKHPPKEVVKDTREIHRGTKPVHAKKKFKTTEDKSKEFFKTTENNGTATTKQNNQFNSEKSEKTTEPLNLNPSKIKQDFLEIKINSEIILVVKHDTTLENPIGELNEKPQQNLAKTFSKALDIYLDDSSIQLKQKELIAETMKKLNTVDSNILSIQVTTKLDLISKANPDRSDFTNFVDKSHENLTEMQELDTNNYNQDDNNIILGGIDDAGLVEVN
jgi:hypothetical protein